MGVILGVDNLIDMLKKNSIETERRNNEAFEQFLLEILNFICNLQTQ